MQSRARTFILALCLSIVAILGVLFYGADGKSETPAVGDQKYLSTIQYQEQKLKEQSAQVRDLQLYQLTTQEKLKTKDEEIDDLKKQLYDAEEIVESRNTDDELADLADRVASLESEKEELKGKLEEADTEDKELLIACLEKRVAELDLQTKDVARLEQYKKESNILRKALRENAETITQFEQKLEKKDEILKATVALEESRKSQLKDELVAMHSSKEELNSKVTDLEVEVEREKERMNSMKAYEQKYAEEKRLRVEKENLLTQLKNDLSSQREALIKVEKNRQNLHQELELTQTSYTQLIQELSKQKPDIIAERKVILAEPVTHKVLPGETLMTISDKYYGTTKKWKRIYEANLEVLTDKNIIRPGMDLIVP